ncbi:MAG: hypothetical protein LIO46_00770 [Clostridiales bacterium]|nr:hypothetical protein [Clostridiales bacterium]
MVAAITAAVACEQEGQPFVLKSVRRKPQAANRRPAWGAAAVREHTRPF